MFVEVHMLQNFAPSNLNRDESGAPKDCEFGGYRRARISSQAIKRAIREVFRTHQLIEPQNRGYRTKRIQSELVRRFEQAGKDPSQGETVFRAALQGLALAPEKKGETDPEGAMLTEYLLFLGNQEVDTLERICLENWETLLKVKLADTAGKRRKAKIDASKAVPKDVRLALQSALDGGKAADVALFGRMLADLPEHNIDAASQVAHAISTNRVSMEFDFFTAVDDLRPEDTEGAGMLGTVEFNSSCFYRYANIDIEQLLYNLGGDTELAHATVNAYLRALMGAVPTGKQNSMAAQNPPSFILAVVRDSGLWSLANAFLDPVRADGQADLIIKSQRNLDAYWARLTSVYGAAGIYSVAWVALDDRGIEALSPHQAGTFDQLVERTAAAAFAGSSEVETT